MSISEKGSPAGNPSTTTPTALPWDSPHVVIRNICPKTFPAMNINWLFCYLILEVIVRKDQYAQLIQK
jgi:hypothetical protein